MSMAGPNEVSSSPPSPGARTASPLLAHLLPPGGSLVTIGIGLTANPSGPAARKVLPLPHLPKQNPALTVGSKTFLARLCEQAERYDGESSRSNTCASLLR